MNHRVKVLLARTFKTIADADKRHELIERAKKKWKSFDKNERTQMRKDILNYGMSAIANK